MCGAKNVRQHYYMVRADNSEMTTLVETAVEKDLSVWMENNGKPSNHVAHVVSKANQLLGLIRRTFTYMDCALMKQLFTALIRPHLEYASVVWHPYLKKDIEMLEGVQHRATKMVPGLAKFSYEERLRRMDLPTLVYRRARGDVIEVFKYMNKIYKVNGPELLPLHETKSGVRTRGCVEAAEERVQKPAEIEFLQHENREYVEQFARKCGDGDECELFQGTF